MKILLLSSSFNGLSQRIHRELTLLGHHVTVELSLTQQHMVDAVELFAPDLIVCPFMKERIPERIWREHHCLIVHPGVLGDRGACSLDWAIMEAQPRWGVSLLQASEVMDGGDIWGTAKFPMRTASKASLYRHEVTSIAAELVRQAVRQYESGKVSPRPLRYGDTDVCGTYKPIMQQSERRIDWQSDDTSTIVRKLNAADSAPGVLDRILGVPVHLYGARADYGHGGAAGELVARSADAVCIATTDGSVWVRTAQRQDESLNAGVKLPAAMLYDQIAAERGIWQALPEGGAATYDDLHWHVRGSVAYLSFDFYNGAMSTDQCLRLRQALRHIKSRPEIRIVVLMGGEDFWSNGIHLSCIEAASDPAEESWRNINAINDVVREILLSPDHVTVAALRANAGAGGAMLPLACDRVLIRDGVVLNPHYGTMGLPGSEYWTYLLPRRVGQAAATEITQRCMPLLASEAAALGMADEVLDEDWSTYHVRLREHIAHLDRPRVIRKLLRLKQAARDEDERRKPLEQYRSEELAAMRRCFFDRSSDYHRARHNFVHKIRERHTPARLALHRAHSEHATTATLSTGALARAATGS